MKDSLPSILFDSTLYLLFKVLTIVLMDNHALMSGSTICSKFSILVARLKILSDSAISTWYMGASCFLRLTLQYQKHLPSTTRRRM